VEKSPPASSWLERNDFIIRRLHSLSGLIPVGAYMVIHLLTNAGINNSVETFQNSVFTIHSLGKVLPIIEWVFIFIPLLFHAIFGVVIIRGGLPNHNTYRYTNNVRYSLQRATGMIAFAFIMWHVFHMHGWFHFAAWAEVTEALNGARFRPYNAASTTAAALQGSIIVQLLYAIGVLSCVFHLANGIWTMGITWGVWVTPASQRWANYVCAVFGVLLAFVGMGALGGFLGVDREAAEVREDEMYEARVKDGSVEPNEHKRSNDANEPVPHEGESKPGPTQQPGEGTRE
jgi:succinate dehydrogenase / fumarate reductase cytochrome b subunit